MVGKSTLINIREECRVGKQRQIGNKGEEGRGVDTERDRERASYWGKHIFLSTPGQSGHGPPCP